MAGKKPQGAAGGVVLPRLRNHQVGLKNIVKDDRITGSRRILAEVLSMWTDLYEYPEVQKQMLELIQQIFGSNPRRIRWVDDDEALVPDTSNDGFVKTAAQQIKNVFQQALKESDVEVSAKDVHLPDQR